MATTYSILKNSVYVICFVVLFIGCTSTPEKVKHKLYKIGIKQMQFQPPLLSVQKGDTVVWINHDIVAHDITEEKAKLWTSGPLATGESWRLVVTESADYYCSIHVVMKGKLVVQ